MAYIYVKLDDNSVNTKTLIRLDGWQEIMIPHKGKYIEVESGTHVVELYGLDTDYNIRAKLGENDVLEFVVMLSINFLNHKCDVFATLAFEPEYRIRPLESDEKTKIEEQLLAEQKVKPQKSKSSEGCYVATCVYGSYDCPEVWTLRRFRDYTLASTVLGRAFIRMYYTVSPILVKWFGERNWFKKFFGGILDKMVSKLNTDGIENTPYEDRDWK